MDPATVIAMIAVHLLSAGVLMLLLSWRVPEHAALRAWALAAVFFGVGYVGRLAHGLALPPPHSVWVDGLMVLAQLLFILGVLNFIGVQRRWHWVLWCGAAFMAVHLVVTWRLGPQARFVLLNASMAALYLAMGGISFYGLTRLEKGNRVRLSLGTFGLLMGTLGLLTGVRAGQIALLGLGPMYQGWFAALYFAFGSFVGVLVSLLVLWNIFESLAQRLRNLARHDPLTGLLNRHGLRDALAAHFARPEAPHLVLAAVDVDHFKRVNDLHGHAAGDMLLRAVAQALQAACRHGDFVARTGGEEFVVGHAAADLAQAMQLAERLRQAAQALRCHPRPGLQLRCTVSVGVSQPIARAEQWEHAASQADRALYAAKHGGRNRCEAFDRSLQTDPGELASA